MHKLLGELRKDYILEKYVIIATERAKRPHEFIQPVHEKKPKIDMFAPGMEEKTPGELYRYPENEKEWQIRVFHNKFPAVENKGESLVKTDNIFFTFSDNFGFHEVIVDSRNIDEDLSDVSEEHFIWLLKTFRERIISHTNNSKIKYVSIFKNHGPKAGTSILHSHCQLLAYNIIPQRIQEKEDACARHGKCPYCEIIQIEKNSLRRCYETNSAVAFAPYASRFPLEIWLFPKKHMLNIIDFTQDEFKDFAHILKQVLLKLKTLNASYNFYLQYGIKDMHFHIEIIPRLTTWAGFEFSTDTVINPTPPEDAAKFYRGEE